MARKIKSKKPNIKKTPTKPKERDDLEGGCSHYNDKMVKNILADLGKEIGISRAESINRFKDCDEEMTAGFWHVLWQKPENKAKFNRINFCSGCRKFEIYYEED